MQLYRRTEKPSTRLVLVQSVGIKGCALALLNLNDVAMLLLQGRSIGGNVAFTLSTQFILCVYVNACFTLVRFTAVSLCYTKNYVLRSITCSLLFLLPDSLSTFVLFITALELRRIFRHFLLILTSILFIFMLWQIIFDLCKVLKKFKFIFSASERLLQLTKI